MWCYRASFSDGTDYAPTGLIFEEGGTDLDSLALAFAMVYWIKFK